MSAPPAVNILTVSIVLFQSPLAQLRDLIDSLIDSLSGAAISHVQCVLVDHSLDLSYAERCRALLAEYDACEQIEFELLVSAQNHGYGAGHNLAMNSVSGTFHLILNPDVVLSPHAISVALETLETHNDCVLLAPIGSASDGTPLDLAKAYPSVWALALRALAPLWLRRRSRAVARYELRDQPSEILRPVPLVSGCCMWVRRAVYDDAGGFDQSYFLYFEDFDLSMRMARHGAVIEHQELAIVHHGGKASRKGGRHLLWFCLSALRFFKRWGWKWLG